MSDQISNVRPCEVSELTGALRASPNAVVPKASQSSAGKGAAGDDRGSVNTASGYIHPRELLRDPTLREEQKRDLLCQWALDAYRLVVSAPEAVRVGAASQLDEAIDALIDLDGGTADLSRLRTVPSSKFGECARAA